MVWYGMAWYGMVWFFKNVTEIRRFGMEREKRKIKSQNVSCGWIRTPFLCTNFKIFSRKLNLLLYGYNTWNETYQSLPLKDCLISHEPEPQNQYRTAKLQFPDTRGKKKKCKLKKIINMRFSGIAFLSSSLFNIILIVVWSAARTKPNPCTVHWSFQRRTSGRSRRKRKRSTVNCFFFLVWRKHAYPCMFHISNSKQLL